MDSKNIKSVLKTQAKVIAYVIICFTVTVIGISYSLYSSVQSKKSNQVVKAGTLQFSYGQGTKITNEDCFTQTTYNDAKTNTACEYSIEITNTGTLPGAYNLSLTSTASTNALELNKLKVILKKDGQEVNGNPRSISSTTTTLVSNEKISPKGKVKYSIIIYVDDESVTDADNEKTISLELQGSAEVSADNNINPT